MQDHGKPSESRHAEAPRTATGTAFQLSIVVPTYKEHDNLRHLVERVFQATGQAGIQAELICVDDNSDDGSESLVRELSEKYPVHIIVRRDERGLSTAVLRGFREARGEVLLVMDADLSHPPEKIPELYEVIAARQGDFVIGSRYTSGGQTHDWPLLRKLNSWGATLLARPLTRTSDPMAGFFALHRQTWENADTLNPVGYKIALELLIKGKCKTVREVPIVFEDRFAGKSKMTVRQQILYLVHLQRLYFYKYPVRSPLILFGTPLLIIAALVWLSV